ncbi:Leucine-rich repeat domain, L domain-like [Phytophthora cactorum]|nr:Leucine-rich repeat domain, L domain-like [Phytophthora cactorum]
MDEVKKEWERFDHGTVEKLQILHCSAMEVPTHIQQFHHLREIYAYNTTLLNGTPTLHSQVITTQIGINFLARSNMTGGLLPLGLHSKDFRVPFSEYDLDSKWPRCAIYIENSLLTDVPPSLMRLQPSTLSLAGNPIRAAPKEIFESGIIQYTICELPQNVSFVLSYATQLELMNTSISFFWAWIDPLAELALELSSTIFAGGSTYCFDLEKILSGTASTFSEPFQAGHSTLLMNASEANWDILRRALIFLIEYVTLSYCGFLFWWLVVFMVHLLTCAYNAGFAKFYWDYNESFLSFSLESYGIGIHRENFLIIAYVHIALASAHARTVSFTLDTKAICKGKKNSASVQQLEPDRTGSVVSRTFTRAYMKLAHRQGFFGVNGKHFHRIHIFREVLETALQTVQAIRMSKYLPRPQLNLFFVGLLVANCWSSVLINSRWFWRGEAHRRFALVVCDCVLDMMSTIGVSVMIVMQYADQYNVALAGFNFDDLVDDNWVAQMLNEAQMVLVVSWSDMAMRAVFSLGIIITTTNMKELLRRRPKRRNRLVPADSRDSLFSYEAHTLLSPLPENTDLKSTSNWKKNSHVKKEIVRSSPRMSASHGIHFLFALWGFVVLALHIDAILQMPLMECVPKVHPMAGALPSCFVVDFNCHILGISGTQDEVLTEWKRFDRRTAVKLNVLHCPAFGVPCITRLLFLGGRCRCYEYLPPKADDDITGAHDNDGWILPSGLQSIDFPASLFDIYFCETNLEFIPDDIDSKWHVGSSVFVENSQLSAVPAALIRLQPYYLVLGGNPIAEVPPELFEIYGMLYLVLARTSISELPRTILNPSMNSPFIDIRDTTVSYFWSWIDPLVEMMLRWHQ